MTHHAREVVRDDVVEHAELVDDHRAQRGRGREQRAVYDQVVDQTMVNTSTKEA